MTAERAMIPETTAEAVNAARGQGRRVIAVGTTATRTLESAADDDDGRVRPFDGRNWETAIRGKSW